ncbi:MULTISPECIES: hypothetical protein [Desulfovibrionaceae]|jgi:hypothetical protein|uniref:hypothetical protein n=1 Tax=Desulfovibrionaceae TaxID=194924 RepID=UPI001A92A232|nr:MULTISPECIES: hypothetical protein [Desulfovibrionaceae]WFS63810.1 hypothetical protein LF599_06505 [Pseudodesulfovibrio thermohalotolerans]
MIDYLDDTTTEYDDAETAALLYEIDVSVSARLREDRGSGGPLNREIHYSMFDLAEAEADEMARARGEI